jgi:hypothetical protein
MTTYGYGYTSPSFGVSDVLSGSSQYRKPATLSSALSGASPLQSGSYRAGLSGTAGYPQLQPSSPYQTPAKVPQQTGAPVNPQGQQQNTAPTPGVYDLNTDPILQQITALSGMGDEQAQAAALKQRQQLLLGYGDPNLSRAVLGDETQAAAAEQNPTSILHQLGQQRDRNVTGLTEGLNKANLFYSGDRVVQEQQGAQDYQGALAGAAGQANQGLDTISGNLASALGANQQQRTQGLNDAYMRALELALAGGYGPAAGGDGYTPNAAGTGWDSGWSTAPGAVPVGQPVFNPGGILEGATSYNNSPLAPTADPNLRKLALALASGTTGSRSVMV